MYSTMMKCRYCASTMQGHDKTGVVLFRQAVSTEVSPRQPPNMAWLRRCTIPYPALLARGTWDVHRGGAFDLSLSMVQLQLLYTPPFLQRHRQWNKSDVPLNPGKVTAHECNKHGKIPMLNILYIYFLIKSSY